MEQHRKRFLNAVILGTIIGLPLGMFRFWQFALAFVFVGGIVTVIIEAVTGHTANLFLVLFVEYLLVTITIAIMLYFGRKRFPGRYL